MRVPQSNCISIVANDSLTVIELRPMVDASMILPKLAIEQRDTLLPAQSRKVLDTEKARPEP
jgi:hypothetical protein